MKLSYRHGSGVCDITVAPGALSHAGELFDLGRKVLVVTDKGVPRQYPQAILDRCPEGWLAVLECGEDHKTTDSVNLILSALLEHGFTRGDAVVAVGGGVVGDTAGFAASCYMRGIDWYNVPTTLLSQVDSSAGGKTGVNFGGVKNMVGAFHHPVAVLIDTDVLETLSPRLFAEGMAEVIKMAATSDAELFSTLESATDIRPMLPEIVVAALRIKIAVVEADPSERGLRAVLNFGHTIGHAIEAAGSGFYHGEAVAAGMLYMAEGEARERLERLLRRFGLPTEDPYSPEELMALAMHDKKRRGGTIKLVRVSEIGGFRFEQATPEQLESIIKARKI